MKQENENMDKGLLLKYYRQETTYQETIRVEE